MTPNHFFRIYSNLPLSQRVLSIDELSGKSLATIYQEIQRLEDQIRPVVVERDEILNNVRDYFIKKNLI